MISKSSDFIQAILNSKEISYKEEDALIKEYRQTKDITTRNKIIEGNLKNLLKITLNIQRRRFTGITTEDLLSVVTISAIEALKYYDPAKSKARFMSYALIAIYREVNRYLEKKRRTRETEIKLDSDAMEEMFEELDKKESIENLVFLRELTDKFSILTDTQQLIMEQRIFEGKTLKQIASDINFPYNKVASLNTAAIAALRSSLTPRA